MKTFLISSLIAVASVAAQAQSPSQMASQPETVSVTGTGRVTLTPDRYQFTAGVQTVATTVDAAVNENNAKTRAVVAALKAAGAADKDIRTSNFAIWPQQDYRQGKTPQIVGYQVSNNITVIRDDVAQAGKLLQAAVAAGVNQSSGLEFRISDPVRGRDEGMKAAFADARAKATLLAQAAGRTLGRALTIAEGSQPVHPTPPPMVRAQALEARVSEIPVEAGSQEVEYQVSVVFELR